VIWKSNLSSNPAANDRSRYERALVFATHIEDSAMMEQLERNGAPPYFGGGMPDKYLEISDFIDDYMGEPRYALRLALMPLFISEYGLLDKVNHLRGLYESFKNIYPQLQSVDLAVESTQLEVPLYLIAGRQDIYADPWAIEDYFDMIQAPRKELIWFETTGQGLSRESSCQVADVFVDKVLPETLCEQEKGR
jgi:hypothetical protein